MVPDQEIDDPELKKRVESEMGDILFVIANIARRWKIKPEEALRKSNQKFIKRVQYIERELKKNGSNMKEASLEQMEELYQTGKKEESS